ncbi:hypothetical protein BaRGS_00007218 [Batillaria attramentaria]|uniref:Uncharacterized protein n=1 Tax=Batillaria attramentaria TaxID=370345 RepID=A0ABD0LQW9_9CAEN
MPHTRGNEKRFRIQPAFPSSTCNSHYWSTDRKGRTARNRLFRKTTTDKQLQYEQEGRKSIHNIRKKHTDSCKERTDGPHTAMLHSSSERLDYICSFYQSRE